MDVVTELTKNGKIDPPKFLPYNINYLCMMGSVAYGCSDNSSDFDVYGFCTPPPDVIFPHLSGEIPGFGRQKKRFDQWQQCHVQDNGRSYDLTVYNIVRYFHLVMEGNPNMVDSLFVPRRCILHTTAVGELIRENRHLFLHKGCWHKFKGYAYSQLHKMSSQTREGKRKEVVEKYGFDVKFAYHVVRLLSEVEQILTTGTIDLERDREIYKAIRRGEWSHEQVAVHFTLKEKQLEEVYQKSDLPWGPDETKIKALLVKCIKNAHSDIEVCEPDAYVTAIGQIGDIVDDLRKQKCLTLTTDLDAQSSLRET